MPSITTPINITKIGCWNVRRMFQIGKTANIVREFNRYKLDIMGLLEVRWLCPTNEADEADKGTFYEQLQRETAKVPILMVMGDANAKVEKSNEGWERAMGQEGIGIVNENGMRLAEMCALNNLIIGGTLFKHLDIHKLSWESPNGRDRNQIDHVMVNGRYKKSVCDVRVMRGADANSGHHLVLAKVKMKLCRNLKPKESNRKMYDVNKLKDPKVSKGFQLELRKRFQQLFDDESTITNEKLILVKEAYNETAEKILGQKKRKHKSLPTAETYRAIHERRKLKEEIGRSNSESIKEIKREEYKTKDKEVKRRARADKRKNLEDVVNQAENAANTNGLSEVYQLTKQLCGRKRNRTSGIRLKNGELIIEDGKKILERWKEHFEEVLK
ncbi:craniofacial development protein 2-like [Saccostrea cucullata]|uniref:craniofacial development protein 2-like n=1 Tax=Saccostrea cuccullata TaxID=36930 RepID=UPI002ED4FFF5